MKVSIGIVAYNEEKYLPTLFNSIKEQDYPHNKIEILLIDSNSKDETKKCFEEFKKEDESLLEDKRFCEIKILDNPGQYLPQGCNVMLKNYTGEAICRIDAHARIPKNFISQNVKFQEEGEKVTGGPRPNIIDEITSWKETLLLAEESKFGSGVAPYRTQDKKAYVSSIFHGMYRREVYEKVGLYNEKLRYTEDNDMSQRISEAGYKICYTPEIESFEYIRPNFKQMIKQKYRNGLWIGKTLKINPKCFSLFHFVPLIFVLALIVTIVIAVVGFSWLLIVMMGLYIVCGIVFTVIDSIRKKFRLTNLTLPGIFFVMHVAYGAGTLIGIFSKL